MKSMKNALKVLVVLGLIGIMLAGLSRVTSLRWSLSSKEAFFQQERQYDVLFVGSSHVKDTINPLVLWEKAGIASYNLGFSAHNLDQVYAVTAYAVHKAHPKMLVVDLFLTGADEGVKSSDPKPANLHKSFDCIPFGIEKIRLVNQYFTSPEEKFSFIFPFVMHHNRWSELEPLDFNWPPNYSKGFTTFYTVGYAKIASPATTPAPLPDSPSVRAVKKYVDLCQANDIQLIFTLYPYSANKQYQQTTLAYANLAAQYGVPFLNFMEQQDILNLKVDFRDENRNSTHLNYSGAQKVSAYMADVLRNEYAMPDRRTDSAYAPWHQDYADYTAALHSQLQSSQSLSETLLLLSDSTLDFALCVQAGVDIPPDSTFAYLLQNLGATDAGLQTQGGYYLLSNEALAAPCEALLPAQGAAPVACGKATFALTPDGVALGYGGAAAITLAQTDALALLAFEHETGALCASVTLPLSALTAAPEMDDEE